MIRPMQAADRAQVLEMMKIFYASDALLIHPSEEKLSRMLGDCLSDDPYIEGYVFETDGCVAGYGILAKSYSTEACGRCIWIEDIYVQPQHRGKGLGSEFLAFVEERYSHSAARIRLEAEPENSRAMEVYRKAGFEVLGYTQLIKLG